MKPKATIKTIDAIAERRYSISKQNDSLLPIENESTCRGKREIIGEVKPFTGFIKSRFVFLL